MSDKSLLYVILFIFSSARALLSPACQCVTFNGTSDNLMGHFTSPGFPSPYHPEISCILYVFTAPSLESRIVEIDFRTFDVGDPKYGRCNGGGYLRLYLDKRLPTISEDDRHDIQLCGNMTNLSQTKFYSSNSVLIMEFHSNHRPPYHSHVGFEGFYRYINAGMYESDGIPKSGSVCTYHIMSKLDQEGQFFSPKYPQNYRSNEDCEWIFIGDAGERVQITFLRIDLAVQTSKDKPIYETRDGLIYDYNHPNRTCVYGNSFNDLITVHDGGTEMDPIIKRFCGKHRHQEILSSGRKLFIKFRTNQQITMQGFAALFKFIVPPKMSGAPCGFNYTSADMKSGVILSQNYPDKYPDGNVCKYRFYARPNSSERVRIEFNEFNLGSNSNDGSCVFRDTLTAYIKVNNTIKAVLKKFCGSNLPPAIMSNGEYLELEFESKRSSSGRLGYNLTYKFVSDFEIKSDERPTYAVCTHVYKSSFNLTGEFTSPNYPGLYPHDTECTYVFNGEGKRVRIDFNCFDVNGTPPGCRDDTYSDYVSFSIFTYADDKFLSKYCTQSAAGSDKILREPVYSDSDYLRVVFKSDSKNEGTGFLATYTFIEPPEDISTASEQSGGNSDNLTSSLHLVLLSIVFSILTQRTDNNYYMR